MTGWTWEDIYRRNLEVFGDQEPACSSPAPDETAENVPERLIEAECSKLLEEDGWRALRTDPVSDRGRGKGFGEVGMADRWFVRPLPGAGPYAVEMVWCEFKTGKNTARKHQQAWHIRERARGFQTWIANEDFPATIEGFREHYANSGLMRRPRWW
jgi:hypothetical protein